MIKIFNQARAMDVVNTITLTTFLKTLQTKPNQPIDC